MILVVGNQQNDFAICSMSYQGCKHRLWRQGLDKPHCIWCKAIKLIYSDFLSSDKRFPFHRTDAFIAPEYSSRPVRATSGQSE